MGRTGETYLAPLARSYRLDIIITLAVDVIPNSRST
jgi:hypothetical protein